MKFSCDCGQVIPDQTDDLPYKAHLIPDQSWNALWEKIDADILLPLSKQKLTEPAASMKLRTLLIEATRTAYQCPVCGRLFIDIRDSKLQAFTPATPDVPRNLLSAESQQ